MHSARGAATTTLPRTLTSGRQGWCFRLARSSARRARNVLGTAAAHDGATPAHRPGRQGRLRRNPRVTSFAFTKRLGRRSNQDRERSSERAGRREQFERNHRVIDRQSEHDGRRRADSRLPTVDAITTIATASAGLAKGLRTAAELERPDDFRSSHYRVGRDGALVKRLADALPHEWLLDHAVRGHSGGDAIHLVGRHVRGDYTGTIDGAAAASADLHLARPGR